MRSVHIRRVHVRRKCAWQRCARVRGVSPAHSGLCLQVRSISLNVRKNVSLNTLSQDVLLKEFSTIS